MELIFVSQDLDKLFKQIQKDSEQMAMDAMIKAANKAYELSKEKAKSCLVNYLKKKPKIYKRITPTPLLKAHLFASPKFVEKGGKCKIKFGMMYDSTKLKGVYKSNSWWHQSGDKWVSRYDNPDKFDFNSQSNGVPEPGWILDNYLKGIHPGWVNGVDRGWVDELKPEEEMEKFFMEELKQKAGELIYESMQEAVIGFLKTNGGGK